ncbi:MAG: helix-turn-helix domain-containing protein [Deinococcales bacterium]
MLEEVRIQDEMIGIPMVEAVISTLGDLALAEGRYLDAISQYKMNLESASKAMYPALANDLVRGLLIGGEIAEAEVVASEAHELCRLAPSHQQGLAEIALGCVLAHKADSGGEQLLRAAIRTLRAMPLGVQVAQAAIHLAKFLLRQGRLEEARELLEENSRFIAELGDSGWLLLGGEGPEIAQLKRMFRSGEPELELRFLGKRCLRVRDAETTLSMRVAELLAVLAAHPNGIGGEQLADALYGDRANASTLKAMVSRARRQLPIEAKPYRVADSYQADFMQVLELLHVGKVQAALELYRGPLLPESDAPAVVELREHLEESMRQAVLASGDPDAMIDLANQQGDDLELWEETRRSLPPNDPRRPLANARIRRIRKRWQAEAH